jgi:hypothetical protein
MHIFSLITQGAHAPNVALTLNRLALGAFFAISGYHKNSSRHATLTRTNATDYSGGKIVGEGAIDMPNIREAIKAIIEGGEKAFRLRQKKYGF